MKYSGVNTKRKLSIRISYNEINYSDQTLSAIAIVYIIVGSVTFAVILIIVIAYICKRKLR